MMALLGYSLLAKAGRALPEKKREFARKASAKSWGHSGYTQVPCASQRKCRLFCSDLCQFLCNQNNHIGGDNECADEERDAEGDEESYGDAYFMQDLFSFFHNRKRFQTVSDAFLHPDSA
jgi:hypothetical protein